MTALLIFVVLFWVIAMWGMIMNVVLLLVKVPAPPVTPRPRLPKEIFLLMPMHDEEAIVQAAVDRFTRLQWPLAYGQLHLVVIEDGSQDHTNDLLTQAAKRYPTIHVLYRRQDVGGHGKGAALNTALIAVRRWAKHGPADTVVGVLDADGQISRHDLRTVADYFANDPTLAMVQTGVRVLGTDHWLARVQDFEFAVLNALVQNLRSHLGNVAGSGNGQFFRLSALHQIQWGNTLLEDFEISTRLLLAGFRTAYLMTARVKQEPTLAIQTYLRQRIRWATGGLQVAHRFGQDIRHADRLSLIARLEMTLFTWLPLTGPLMVLLSLGAIAWQVANWAATGTPNSAVIFIFFLLLLEYLFYIILYTRMSQGSWRTAWGLFWSLPVTALLILPISLGAIWQYLRHDNHWAKTTHGVL
ncbi:glycosyltransferase [Schleiferilactobacillus perolens]|uniref:Glycosyltransferase n=1 Tax=Schleiferilactobacillus perolens DSM 12744 TaxID=1423792 RepID=A0A0R1MXP3_9LACO|nr:glycosyltransferase family 2 protein [Schleiferilactobacillus perolens]KRL08875.1 glycosyltransferase [Schleiferilactobacillus perolens DSM 12744]